MAKKHCVKKGTAYSPTRGKRVTVCRKWAKGAKKGKRK